MGKIQFVEWNGRISCDKNCYVGRLNLADQGWSLLISIFFNLFPLNQIDLRKQSCRLLIPSRPMRSQYLHTEFISPLNQELPPERPWY